MRTSNPEVHEGSSLLPTAFNPAPASPWRAEARQHFLAPLFLGKTKLVFGLGTPKAIFLSSNPMTSPLPKSASLPAFPGPLNTPAAALTQS